MAESRSKRAQQLDDILLPPDYKPDPTLEYMNDRQLAYFRRKLLEWRRSILEGSSDTLSSLEQEGGMQESDINDRATLETDHGIELRTRDRERKLINKIDEALDRIELGEYGYCEETGEEIGLARLEARPVATLCVEAQERHERRERTRRDMADLHTD